MRCAHRHTTGETRDRLQRLRNLARVGNALDRQQLAHLLQAQCIVACGHLLGHRRLLHHHCLAVHLIGNAELLEQFALDVHAARAIRVRHRLRREQRRLELLRRADVGHHLACLDHDTDARIGQIDARIRTHLARLDEIVERVTHHDHDVGRLAARQTVGDRLGRLAHRRAPRGVHVIAARRFELRQQQLVCSGEPAGIHHVQVFCADRGGAQQRSHDDAGAEAAQHTSRRNGVHGVVSLSLFWMRRDQPAASSVRAPR